MQPPSTCQGENFVMQAQEDEELARAIAASLGDDASSVPAQQAASSEPAQPSGISARPRAAAWGGVEAGDVPSAAASEPTSQPANISTPPMPPCVCKPTFNTRQNAGIIGSHSHVAVFCPFVTCEGQQLQSAAGRTLEIVN